MLLSVDEVMGICRLKGKFLLDAFECLHMGTSPLFPLQTCSIN